MPSGIAAKPPAFCYRGAGASWLIAGLPPAAGGTDSPVAPAAGQAAARVGPFTLRATAAEAEDAGGFEDPANPRPAGLASGLAGPPPANMDQHLRTGVPTLHYVLTARAASPPARGQTWLLQLDRAAPQWAAPPALLAPPALGGLRTVLPLTAPAGPLAAGRVLQDGAVGAAYPGQQHWLTLQGGVIRQATRTERVTFHGAEVVHDAGFGGDRIVWERPETETTASGISITVLNGRPGRRDTSVGQDFGQSPGRDWWYDRANAELLVAWRLPPGVLPWARAPLGSPRVAPLGSPRVAPLGASPPPPDGAPGAAPGAAGALLASPDTARPDPYPGAVRLPGGGDARALTRDGYSLLRLSVWPAQRPARVFSAAHSPLPALPPGFWREGPFVVSARPLPRRLLSLTLLVTFREEKERHALRLVVPVRAAR